MNWYFGSWNEPTNYTERVDITLPPNVHSTLIPNDQCLDQMLERGEIDAAIGSVLPRSFQRGSPNVKRLFPNYQEEEAAYFQRTGFFPIMHTLVLKREIYESAPWVATSLYKAFVQAKAQSERSMLRGQGGLFCTLPWLQAQLDERDRLMGNNPFSYGLEENRKTLEAFFRYSQDQGLTSNLMTVEEMFVPETHSSSDRIGT